MQITDFLFTTVAAAAVLLAGCKKDDSVNVPEDGRMTLTTALSGEATIHLSGTGTATIDWGDGSTPDTAILSTEIKCSVHHDLSGADSHTIVIDGKDITTMDCYDLQLTTLDVSQNTILKRLSCSNNQLISLDVSQNPVLERLSCSNNQLISLDVSQNPVLERLICDKNQLTSLDMGRNTALTYLICSENQLKSLNVSQNPDLITLSCSDNQITDLDVSRSPMLVKLFCGSNGLTNLDVSRNPMLEDLFCESNRLTTEALNALFGTLHSGGALISIDNNPGSIDCDKNIAESKGWWLFGEAY